MKDATYDEVLERLKDAVGTASDQDLAAKLGLSRQAVADARARKTVPPAWILKVAKTYKVSADWLFFGGTPVAEPQVMDINFLNKNRYSENSVRPPIQIYEPQTNDYKQCDVDLIMIPMVEARLSAGTGSLETSGEIERSYAFRSDFLRRKGNPKNMVLMRVDGDSMQPEIMNKDVVLLDQSKTNIRAGQIFAVGFEEAIYLKKIDTLPGKIILKSTNPAYPPVEIQVGEQEGDAFRIIGQVIWCGREY